MLSKTSLIILGITKTGDNAIVLHTLSAAHGRKGFIVNVNRKTPMSQFLPLNILEAEVIENPKSKLWRIRNITVKHPLMGIRSDIYKNTMTLFMSEVLFRIVREGSAGEDLFTWCEKSILTLDAIKSDYSNFHLRFLLELAIVLGFSPSIADLTPFAADNIELLASFIKASFAESMLIPMNGNVRNKLADALLRYISYHSETRINIQSLKVLRELYGN